MLLQLELLAQGYLCRELCELLCLWQLYRRLSGLITNGPRPLRQTTLYMRRRRKRSQFKDAAHNSVLRGRVHNRRRQDHGRNPCLNCHKNQSSRRQTDLQFIRRIRPRKHPSSIPRQLVNWAESVGVKRSSRHPLSTTELKWSGVSCPGWPLFSSTLAGTITFCAAERWSRPEQWSRLPTASALAVGICRASGLLFRWGVTPWIFFRRELH